MYRQSNSTPFPSAVEATSLFTSWTPRTSYYVAVLVMLLVAWFLKPKSQCSKLSVPFYGASKLKWIFDAESQIVASYSKVRLRTFLSTRGLDDLLAHPVSRPGLSNQGDGGNSSYDPSKVHRRAQGVARGYSECYGSRS